MGFRPSIVMKRNQLSGSIPDAVFYIPMLQECDLLHNQLTGNLPDNFATISSLRVLEVTMSDADEQTH
eukprot:666787-Amphidinium_carterae.3